MSSNITVGNTIFILTVFLSSLSAYVENRLFHWDGFFSQVPSQWIGPSNIHTPTVTSRIPHLRRGIWAKCRGVLGVKDGIEDGFFNVISRHFWMKYCSYSTPKRLAKAQPTTQVRTTRVWPWHPYPSMAWFLSQQRYCNWQKWRVMLPTTSSAGTIVHSAPLTKISVTGCYQLFPRVSMNKISKQQLTCMAMMDSASTMVSTKERAMHFFEAVGHVMAVSGSL